MRENWISETTDCGAYRRGSTAPSLVYELGSSGALQKAGITIGASAGDSPPGLYMFSQFLAYQATNAGPHDALLNSGETKTAVQAAAEVAGFLIAPG